MNGVISSKHVQSYLAGTEMLDDVEDFLWFGDISWRKEEEEEEEEEVKACNLIIIHVTTSGTTTP